MFGEFLCKLILRQGGLKMLFPTVTRNSLIILSVKIKTLQIRLKPSFEYCSQK